MFTFLESKGPNLEATHFSISPSEVSHMTTASFDIFLRSRMYLGISSMLVNEGNDGSDVLLLDYIQGFRAVNQHTM